MDVVRKLRVIAIVGGMSLLGTVIGIFAGVFAGTMPGITEIFTANSGGWDGAAKAVGVMFFAGALGLLGMICGAWQGFRITARKTETETDQA